MTDGERGGPQLHAPTRRLSSSEGSFFVDYVLLFFEVARAQIIVSRKVLEKGRNWKLECPALSGLQNAEHNIPRIKAEAAQ